MKTFKITDPIFRTEPLFVTDCTVNELSKYLWRRFKIKWDASEWKTVSGTQLTFDKPRLRVVYFEKMNKSPDNLGTLVHELFHLTVRICRDKGIPIIANIQTGECGDESAAYIQDFFFREVYKRI